MVKVREQPLELKDQLRDTLEEARMVLPGIQALFGFQLIAVFQPTFSKVLSPDEQRIHLLAVALAAVAAALVIAPAAIHRKADFDRVTPPLLKLSGRLLTWGTYPLAIAVFLDFALLANMILHDAALAWGLAIVLLVVYFGLWVALPLRFKASEKAGLSAGG